MTLFYNISKQNRHRPIYRIFSYERLIELFETNSNVLVHPALWDDPFENFILKSKVRLLSGEIKQFHFHENLYGQCWSLHKASDAMWRIYSPNGDGIRVKTTPDKLLRSLYYGGAKKPDMSCVIGKVNYLPKDRLSEFANHVFKNGSVTKENLFNSLLVKRLAFKHEREIRVLYFDLKKIEDGRIFRYSIDPHNIIDQIMIDPRLSIDQASDLKNNINNKLGYKGEVKRSLLYEAPNNIILQDNKV